MAYYNGKKILGVVANNANVNTGTFDPTSDNPAGQKSTAGALVSKDEYYATYAIARFAGLDLENYWKVQRVLTLFTKATNLFYFMCGMKIDNSDTMEVPSFENEITTADRAFSVAKNGSITTIIFNNIKINGYGLFENTASIKNILVKDGASAEIFINLDYSFLNCNALEEIGAFNVFELGSMNGAFVNCFSLKHIHFKNIPVSFDISASTKFEEADLVEIINNLMDLTGKASQTLTMGATNLAKLTDAEKAIATNKNWVLA